MIMVKSGANSYLVVGIQDDFNTPATTLDKTIGRSAQLSNDSSKNNATALFDIGSRSAQEVVKLKLENSVSMSAKFSNIVPFQLMMKEVSAEIDGDDDGDGYLTSVYTIDDSFTPKALTVEYEVVDGKYKRLIGVVPATLKMSVGTGDTVNISMDCEYKTFTIGDVASTSSIIDDNRTFTFYHGEIKVDNGSLGIIESFDVSLGGNPELLYGIGDFKAQGVIGRQINVSGKMVVLASNTVALEKYFGIDGKTKPQASAVDKQIVLTFTENNADGTVNRIITFTIDGVVYSEISNELKPNEKIALDMSFIATRMILQQDIKV
jgi:hypothetical protein